jgi:hypothetical protein
MLANTLTPTAPMTRYSTSTTTPTLLPLADPQVYVGAEAGGISGGLAFAGIIIFFVYLYYAGPSADSLTRASSLSRPPPLTRPPPIRNPALSSTPDVVTTNVMYNR